MATRQRKPTDDPDAEEWAVEVSPSGAGRLLAAASEEPEPQGPAERLAVMMDGAGRVGDAQVRVYRINDKGGYTFCETYSPDEFESGGDMRLVRGQFGAGRYAIQIFGSLPGGGKGLLSKLVVEIAADPKPNPPPGNNGTDLAQIAAILQQGQERMLQVITTLQDRPQPDPMASMRGALELLTLARTAMGADQAPQPKSQISEIIAAVRELREVSSEINPQPEKEDDMSKLMGLGGQVVEIVKAATQKGPAPASPTAFPPIVAPASLAPSPRPWQVETQPDGAVNPIDPIDLPTIHPARQENPVPLDASAPTLIQTLIGQAVVLAQAGMPAHLGAALLLGTDDSPGLPEEVLELLERDDWWQMLSSVPELQAMLGPHEAWIRRVRELMLAELALWDAEDESAINEAPAASPEKAS